MKPYRCPVCEGRGVVEEGFYNPPMSHEYRPTSTAPIAETCKSCSGQGILWSWDSSPVPDYPPWVSPGDGNTTSPPFTITWKNPISLDNLPPNDGRTIAMNSAIGDIA